MIFACVTGTPRALVAHRMLLFSGVFGCGGARDASGSGAAGVKQTPCGLCRVLRGSPCGDAGADGGTRTRDLFLTKEVLYLLSYISVSMILTVCGDLSLPAFLPPDGFTKEVLYLLSYISVSMILTVCGDLSLPAFLPLAGVTKEVLYLLSYISAAFRAGSRRRMLYDYMFSPRLCQRNSGSRPRFFGGRGE